MRKERKRAEIMVVPLDGVHFKWAVTVNGALIDVYAYKKVAVKVARDLAIFRFGRKLKSQVVVLKRNGTIQTEWTYGDDPKSRKG